MKIRVRNLNNNECYACSKKDLKAVFLQADDLFVSFGYLHRDHCYDGMFIKRPRIEGLVIADIEINKRLNIDEMSQHLSFYVIADSRYTQLQEDVFKNTVLSTMYEWYQAQMSQIENLIPGVEVLLIEWTGEEFRLHKSRYH